MSDDEDCEDDDLLGDSPFFDVDKFIHAENLEPAEVTFINNHSLLLL